MDENPKKIEVDAARFVSYVLQKLQSDDTGFRAALTRADNPATEAQAWSVLVKFCDLKNDRQRLPLALIGACMARVRAEENGKQSFGEALQLCKEKLGEDDERIERKLRRVLTCDDTLELVQVLRPILRFVVSQGNVALDYIQLLKDVLYFNEKTKLIWASQYYNVPKK